MRKTTWWNTIKQVIEETNHAKTQQYVRFNISKIRSLKTNVVAKQAQYTIRLNEFKSSEEGKGLTKSSVSVCRFVQLHVNRRYP